MLRNSSDEVSLSWDSGRSSLARSQLLWDRPQKRFSLDLACIPDDVVQEGSTELSLYISVSLLKNKFKKHNYVNILERHKHMLMYAHARTNTTFECCLQLHPPPPPPPPIGKLSYSVSRTVVMPNLLGADVSRSCCFCPGSGGHVPLADLVQSLPRICIRLVLCPHHIKVVPRLNLDTQLEKLLDKELALCEAG